jgi:hypothetical protein
MFSFSRTRLGMYGIDPEKACKIITGTIRLKEY